MGKLRNPTGKIAIVGVLAALGMFCRADEPVAPRAKSQQRGVMAAPQQAKFTPLANPALNASPELVELVQQALKMDAANLNQPTIQALRQFGPAALQYLLTDAASMKSPNWDRVLDTVAQQKDAQYSGLYWFTDLEEAMRVARRDKKPILSLRLLGKLTDDLSCANSRFFRTTLYPNPEVRDLLASQFILHWQSVRPVPTITVDFGDGRHLKRTITGNSLHLVLDDQGRTVDVLPGLYGAEVFAKVLQSAGSAAIKLRELTEQDFLHESAAYHNSQIKALSERWTEDCQKLNLIPAPQFGIDQESSTWTKLATLYREGSRPKPEAVAAIVGQAPPARVAAAMTMTKTVAENPLMRMIVNVTETISEDTVRNEYHLHVRIHNWFTSVQPVLQRELLVTRVYSELFLSPLNDPWYGLSKPDRYSAVDADGRIDAVTQNTRR
jgi:hypothetical protein